MKKYYQEETKKAINNFSSSYPNVDLDLIYSMVKIKKACALSNFKNGTLNKNKKDAIIKACDIILEGKLDDQFVVSGFQGGAGTAINMNVNEVLAGLSSEILKNKEIVHPNDDVNQSQSTNDVNPSALRVTTYFLIKELTNNLSFLINSFDKKSREFKDVIKLGRTHLQDAVPTTLGAEFKAYSFNLKEHKKRLDDASSLMINLSLGGTAIGNSINADKKYINLVYKELNDLTKIKFKPAGNFMSKTSSSTDFLLVSQAVTSLSVELSKIANDLKFMSSGPLGGIGEISLANLQKGSSIMPGKVNPIIPELINQLYFLVSGNNLAIERACEASNLELNVMFPVISSKLMESLKISSEAINKFDKLCISSVSANKDRCLEILEKSTAYATLFVPILGYDLVSSLVFRSISENKNLKDLIISSGEISSKDFDRIIKDYKKML